MNDKPLLDETEKHYFRNLPRCSEIIAPSPELIQLTCAAITGLCHTSMESSPSEFGAMAARIAKAAHAELMKPTEPTEPTEG